MVRDRRLALVVGGWVVLVMTWGWSVRADGEEPAEAFLNALRDNGYDDAALLYLDRLENNPLTGTEMQANLSYERGVTLVRAATRERDRAAREQMLNEAKVSLETFLREHPESPNRLFARRQFSLLLREWAGMKVEQARRTDDAELLKEAAKLYDESRQASVEASTQLRDELLKLQGDNAEPTEQEGIDQRNALRGEYLLALLRGAESLEEKAETEPADTPARKTLLEEASKGYHEIFTKYGAYAAGLRARLYEARCLAKLGDYEQALKYVTDDLLSQLPDDQLSQPEALSSTRLLKTEALLLAIDAWMQPSKRDYAQVIAQATSWLDRQRPDEEESPEWIQLQLKLAQTHTLRAGELFAQNPRDGQIKDSREAARKLARVVSRIPSPYQDEARRLLTEIPGGVAAARTDTREPAKTFGEARTRATEAIAEMQTAQAFLDVVPERLEREQDEGEKARLQQEFETYQAALETQRGVAMENLQLALSLSDATTPVEDVNLIRRLLAYLYYREGEYYDAAVVGEFTGRRFPGSAGAREAAQIALAAYLKLYEASTSETKDFEADRIVALANFIVDTWAGTPEAAEAINTLIPFLIRQGHLDKARQYVENIPPDTSERASAELRVGEGLWRDYLLGVNRIREWELAAREPEADVADLQAKIAAERPRLDEIKKVALDILESGVARMKQAGTVNATVPQAVLSLAQIYVDSDESPKAIELLDDSQIGVLPMLARKDEVINSPRLREQAYSVALSAVVSALSKAKSTEERTALIQRSRDLIQALRDEVGDSAESQQRLVDIFYRLARRLETQLKLLDTPEDRRILSEGFNTFLEQVRSEAKDLRILNWVAESFNSLGNGLAGDEKSAQSAQACYENAGKTYDQILANAAAFELSPELIRQMRFRKGLALRGARQFDEASKIMAEVVTQDNRRLEYQIEAARTYQLWGDQPQQALKLLDAIRGTGGANDAAEQPIWGWSRIARITQRSKQYREAFHEARYNTAACHYKFALRLRQPADRTKYLKLAKDDVVLTQRMFPNMGGTQWHEKYDALLRKIQRSLGEPVAGLDEKR